MTGAQPLASFTAAVGYTSSKNVKSVAELKERLQSASIPRLDATIKYLEVCGLEAAASWKGKGRFGGDCTYADARVARVERNRLSALNAVFNAKVKARERAKAKAVKKKAAKVKKVNKTIKKKVKKANKAKK